MVQLVVRDLDEEVVRALQRQAATHGNSIEVEIRDILRNHLLGDQSPMRSFKEVMATMSYYPEDEDLLDLR